MFDQHILIWTSVCVCVRVCVRMCVCVRATLFSGCFWCMSDYCQNCLGLLPSQKLLKMDVFLARWSIGLFAVAGISNDSNKQKQVKKQL